MIFYFLISIVFIAEIIIAFAIVFHIIKLDKKLIEYSTFINDVKPLIKDIMVTARKLSEEFLKLTPKLVDKVKSFVLNMIKNQLKSVVGALTFWLVKKEVEKHV